MSMGQMGAKAQWTVLVYLNGDNDLESAALWDFQKMALVGSTADVHIVAQFDRSGRFASTMPQWAQTLRFRIEQGMEPLPVNALMDLGKQNMGDGRVLRDFVRWGCETFPAERYFLIIWDHGQGWRLAESIPVSGTIEELRAFSTFRHRNGYQEACRHGARWPLSTAPVPALSAQRTVAGGLRYVTLDDTSGDHLYIREIQDCLAGLPINVIGFDACLMATIETAYAMRDIADVLVASEELQADAGWDYRDWLSRLLDNPQMDAKELGTSLVESYRSAYEEKDPARTLAAVRLNDITDLAAAIDALASELIEHCSVAPDEIFQTRRACLTFGPGYGMHTIDLVHFCDELITVTANASLRELASQVATRARDSVLLSFAGAERQGPFGSTGLAIYFPETRALFNTDPDHVGYTEANTIYPIEFAQHHLWGTFLNAYYRLVR